jgi:imidazolonepropionase-like amidohydrolase
VLAISLYARSLPLRRILNHRWEQIKEVKDTIAAGADWVKVFGSTGGFDNVTGDETVSYDEMKAIVDTAHAAGRKVAIHSYGPAGAKDAIRAGCDTLEHATDMDDATIAEMVVIPPQMTA